MDIKQLITTPTHTPTLLHLLIMSLHVPLPPSIIVSAYRTRCLASKPHLNAANMMSMLANREDDYLLSRFKITATYAALVIIRRVFLLTL